MRYVEVLDAAEQAAFKDMTLGCVDDEIRLCRLRIARLLRAEREADGEPELEEVTLRDVADGVAAKRDEKFKRQDYAGEIYRLVGRIESLEKTRLDLLAQAAEQGEMEPIGEIVIREV